MSLLKLSYNSITGVPLMLDGGNPSLRLGKVGVLEGLEADALGHGMATCDSGSVMHTLYLLSLGSLETDSVDACQEATTEGGGSSANFNLRNTKINNSA
jgi:hypothetical protein